MLKRLQSLELPMTHINHLWPLYTAYECTVMMILPCTTILPTAQLKHRHTINEVSGKQLSSLFPASRLLFPLPVFPAPSHDLSPPTISPVSCPHRACTRAGIHLILLPLWSQLALDRSVPASKRVVERKRLHSLYRLNL